MSLYTLDDPGDLVAPTILAAFDGWVDAGAAATTALEQVAGEASVIATFDPDALFDYRARRPPLEIVDGRLAELTWPELVIRRTRVDDRDLLVLVGPEPDYRWRAVADAVIELAHRLGVAEWISLGAIPAAVPHTRSVPILGTESAPGLLQGRGAGRARRASCACRRRWSRRSRSRSPGPGSRRSATSRRCRTTSPARTRRRRSPCSRRVGHHLGAHLPAGDLEDEARQLRSRLDAAAAIEETTRTYVERLESMVDEQRLPAGDDLIADIERFLRDRGGESTQR